MKLFPAFASSAAMVVRYITHRFIGDYDSSERVYSFNMSITAREQPR
jgi:hypothetical protein